MTVRKYPQQTSVPEAEPPPSAQPDTGKGRIWIKIELVTTLEAVLRIVAIIAVALFLASRFGITPDQLVKLVQVLFK